MRKSKLIFCILCFGAFTTYVKAQEAITVSYNQFINTVLQNNPMAKRAGNISNYGQLQYKSAMGNYDPQLAGSYESKSFDNKHYFTTFSGEVKQQVFTSQFIKAGYDYAVGSNINPEVATYSYGMPYLGLEVGLLQGMMIDPRRAQVLKSKEYIGYYESEKNIVLNDLLFESTQKYFDWLFSIKQLSVNRYFLDLAQQRLRAVEDLMTIGERAIIDTVEAAIFFQSRVLDYQGALIENQKSENNLRFFIWQNEDTTRYNGSVIASDSLDFCFELVKNNLQQTLNSVIVSNPVISQYRSYQNVLEIEKRLKKEMIKPRLNVSYNFLSLNKFDYNPNFSQNNYKFGASLSFPVFLRNPRNEFKMARLNARNNKLDLLNKNSELDYKASVLKQNLSVLSQQVVNAQKTVTYSKRLVDAERDKYFNGESSLFLLNMREGRWLEAELKLAEYKLKFVKTYVNLIYIAGNLNYKL